MQGFDSKLTKEEFDFVEKQQIGIIGLGVMGKNLALNMESKGFGVSVYDPWQDRIHAVMEDIKGKNIAAAHSIEEFASSLETPRKIILLVKAGNPVDDLIEQLKPHISCGDILIDGGNSFFMDTIRRSSELEALGYNFMGTGISGGEEGALKGPAIMAGGQMSAYKLVEPILTAISAKVHSEPCCAYMGTDGAGHYVKMIHNGIEYGDMQLICEAYHLLKGVLGLSAQELHNTFSDWNKGELDSYLIEITSDIFGKTDPDTGKPMVDVILDRAGQKGTGKWASQSALDLGVSAPTIAQAVFARCISAIKDERQAASKLLNGPPPVKYDGTAQEFIEAVRKALYASKICSYAQGFALLKAAALEYSWDLNYGNIAMIFRGGCIIRARFLQKIKDAYDMNPELPNLMLDPYFKDILQNYQEAWRKAVSMAVSSGIPIPAFSSALAYFDSYRSEFLPANLLQAQRDYFGAHMFERVDRDGVFHFGWMV